MTRRRRVCVLLALVVYAAYSQLQPSAEPQAAQDFFTLRRAPSGQAVPMTGYITAAESLAAMPGYSSGTWQALGPAAHGGRIPALVVDSTNAAVLYAASAAGVWKTTSSGAAWSRAGDFPAYVAVSSLAIGPVDPSILYAGTGLSAFAGAVSPGLGIYRTANGGSTWTRLPSTSGAAFTYVNDMVVSPNADNRIYVATGTGVWLSTDSGATWDQTLSVSVTGGCLDLATRSDMASDDVLASCGTLEQATVYRNTDAAGTGTWSAVLTETGMGRTSLAIAPSNQNIVYALAASITAGPNQNGLHGVFRSTDGGTTWTAQVRSTNATKLNRLLLTNAFYASNADCARVGADSFSSMGWYSNVIAVDPTDAARVWVGGVDVFRSDDGGANWGLASYSWADSSMAQHVPADHHALVFAPGYDGVANKRLFVATDGGIFRTDDARAGTAMGAAATCDPNNSATAWTAVHSGLTASELQAGAASANGSSFYVSGRGSGILRGADVLNAVSWTRLLRGDRGSVVVDQSNPSVVYASGAGLDIVKSTDGGASFSPAVSGISDVGLFVSPLASDPGNNQTLWTGGSYLWRTVDGAATWTRASAAVAGGQTSSAAVAHGNPNHVVAGTSSGFILRSDTALSDNAQTAWSSTQPRPGFVSSIAFDPSDSDIVYATYSTFGGAHVWKSVDGGSTWAAVDGTGHVAIPDIPVNSIAVDPTTASRLYIGTDLGVFVSVDAGASWSAESGGPGTVPVASVVVTATGTLFAFTQGDGVWRVPIDGAAGPTVTVSFTAAATSSVETASPVHVAVRIITKNGGPTNSVISVDYATVDGTATSADYTAASGTLTFPAGTASGTAQFVDINLVDDATSEPDETFTINLVNPTAASLANPRSHIVTIVNSGTPAISIGDATVIERNSGTNDAFFTLSLSIAPAVPTTVHYQSADGSATAGFDYVATSGTLTFAPGETSKTIAVAVIGDLIQEANETFTVTLSNPGNGTLADATGTAHLLDDDGTPPLGVAFDDVRIFEEDFATGGGGFYNYVIDDGTFTCVPGEAKPGADYYTRVGCRQFLPWIDGHIESRSPYWVDPNHKFDEGTSYPGIGFLNIVGFLWHGTQLLDLTDARMTFKVLLEPGFDFKGGHLSLWFQAACIPRPGYPCAFTFADYIVDVPIETKVIPGEWSEVSLTPHESVWRCLGAQTTTQQLYGCMPIAEALANVENIGFLITPVPADPTGDNSVGASIKIDDIRISRPVVEQVRWTDVSNATAAGTRLTRVAGTGWTAGAVSSKQIESGDGFVQFTAVETNTTRVFGLARRDTVPGYEDIDFGIGVNAAGALQIYELGTLRGSFGTYAPGDRLSVAVEAGVVRYHRNGTLLYTSEQGPSYPLRPQAALFSAGATVEGAVVAGRLAENVEWANLLGVSSSGNRLTRVAAEGSPAGGVSAQSIPFGDGFVDFTVDQVAGTGTVGLTADVPGYAEAGIDFGLRLNNDGSLEVVEGGVSRGLFGTYAAGNRLRVGVESGTVRYRRNGLVIYTSSLPPSYPLTAHASLLSGGAGLADAVIRGAAETVAWRNVENLQATPGRLEKRNGTLWDAGASSTRALQSGDGFVEFTVGETGTSRTIGLSRGDGSVDQEEIDFGFAFEGTNLLLMENGVLGPPSGSLGNYKAGDRLRVAVEGGKVRYFQNGRLLYTSLFPPVYPLVVDASISSANTVLTNVVMAGRLVDAGSSAVPAPPVVTIGGTTVVEGDAGLVEAVFAVSLSRTDSAPTTVSYHTMDGTALAGQDYVAASGNLTFAPGQTAKTIKVLLAADAVAEATETFGLVLSNPVNGTLALGAAIATIVDNDGVWTWVNGGAAITGQSVTKSAGVVGWNAGASLTRSMSSGDGFVEFTAAETNTYRIVGLTHRASTSTFEDLDFGIMLSADREALIHESGTFIGNFGTFAAGDHFRISAVGGRVRYWLNDRLLYTSTRTPQYPLRAGVSLFSMGATVQNLVFLAASSDGPWDAQTSSPITWTGPIKSSTSGNSVTKTSGNGWDAGAVSTASILSGTGYMEFTAAGDNTYRAAGLSRSNTSEDFSDIDFAILLTAERQVAVYERGEFRGVFASYAAGDRFRVSVGSRVVRYWRNGAILYTSTKPPSYPLAVDTSLFTIGSSVSAVTLGGSTGIDPAVWDISGNVSVTDTRIVKAGAAGWDAGVVSKKLIRSGDGFAEFVAAETNTYRIFGLDRGSSAASFDEVDFGIMLTGEGTIAIYESGSLAGGFGSYATGDRFRVSIAGGTITYWRNSTRMYTSGRTPVHPLRAAAALFTSGATIESIRVVRALDPGVWSTQSAEDVAWKSILGSSASGSSLSKTASAGWNAGAVSTKMIASGDGYVEFKASGAPGYRIAGLSNDDTNQDFADVDFGVMTTAEGQVLIYEAGQLRGSVGPYVAGDVFRVGVSDGIVRYWQNQQIIYTSTVPAVYPLLFDTALFSPGTVLSEGHIAGSVLETESSGWNSAAGVTTTTGGDVAKSGASAGWNAGAVSRKTVQSGDAFVDFVAGETDTYRAAGLTTRAASVSFEDLDFAVLLTGEQVATIYESGAYIGAFGTYESGDRFRIGMTGGVVRYWRNDQLLHTSARSLTYPLRVGTAFFTPGASIGNIRFVLANDSAAWDSQTGETVTWTHVFGSSAPAGGLTKSGPNGWDAGAASTKLIGSGAGYVDFTASGALGYRIAGLSTGDSTQDFADVDFGILLTAEGQVHVTERGQSRGLPGVYVTGDQFRVSVSDGVVRYWQNQQLIYTSSEPPAYPLLVDTALYSTGASISNAKLAGALQTDVTGWNAITGVSVTATSVAKQGTPGWNAGAVSKKTLTSGDGFVEFAVSETTAHRIGGLTTKTVATTFEDIDFGVLLTETGDIVVYEAGSSRAAFGKYVTGDHFRVALASGGVQYWRNATLLYTSLRVPSYPLRVGTAMFTTGATLSQLRFVLAGDSAAWDSQQAQDVAWTNIAGASANGNNLSKTGSAGWNAGALSTTAISSGDGFMEFTATETNTYRAAGLSRGDLNQTFEDIDYGVVLTAEGQIVIYEGTAFRGVFGSYAPGDRFRVSVSGLVVRYWRNGILLYSSTVPPVYPLAVDTSLFSSGATITNVVIAGSGGGMP